MAKLTFLQVLAGYDEGLDARQPRDLKVPKYTSLVCYSLSTCAVDCRLIIREGLPGLLRNKETWPFFFKGTRDTILTLT